jgi:hypothetical protein
MRGCKVWGCVACRRGFVQYTAADGYEVKHPIRAVNPALVV